MNRVTLKYELDLDFILIAITAPLKDYQVCYKINKYLRLNFERQDEHELLADNGSGSILFSRYVHANPNDTEYLLLANKGTAGFLIPEMNKVDYFFMIRDFIDDEDLKEIISGLNNIPEVLVAAEVDPRKLKSRENLIF